MTDRSEARIDELIALAALGELTEADELELDTLLTDDADLADEVDGALDAAAMLQGSLAEAPPAALRASVLDAIASTPQAPTQTSSVDEPPEASAPVIDLASRRRSRLVPLLSAAAAMVLLAGVGIVFVRGDSGPPADQVAVEVVVDADDAVSRQLEGELGGTLTVVYSPGEQAIVIDGDGLPVLGEDRAFVLWFVDDDGATPVQIFRPDDSGAVLMRVDDVDPPEFLLGITEEDAAGSDTPTEPILALA